MARRKKAYKKPKVVELGTLSQLTRGTPGTGFDLTLPGDLKIG